MYVIQLHFDLSLQLLKRLVKSATYEKVSLFWFLYTSHTLYIFHLLMLYNIKAFHVEVDILFH